MRRSRLGLAADPGYAVDDLRLRGDLYVIQLSSAQAARSHSPRGARMFWRADRTNLLMLICFVA